LAPINPSLLRKIKNKLGIEQARAYKIIGEMVRSRHVPRHIAALIVASEAGVAISNYASDEDFKLMRRTENATALPSSSPSPSANEVSTTRIRRQKAKTSTKTKSDNRVFVVYGRNEKIRKALFAFLRSLGIHPIEWNKALALTKQGSPYVGQVVEAAFKNAKVIVVLFTPDDEAKLKAEFIKRGEPTFERRLTGQPRPNVLFEAGMAFGRQPATTILVQVGKVRAVSDVAGRHIVHLGNDMASRQEFVGKLKTTGLSVDDIGKDWHTEGDFTL
jgi:predicted nucleotide-binding protein